MKMGFRLYLATLVLVLVVVAELEAAVAPVHNVIVKPGKNQKCICMNGKWCEGEIVNDVECHPSYIMVCCIQAEPEPNPPYPLYPLNRFGTDTEEPQSEKEPSKTPRPLEPIEKLSEVINETLAQENNNNKGEDSSEPSSESSEEVDHVKEQEREQIKITVV